MKPLVLISLALFAANSYGADSKYAEEFGNRWTRTRKMAIGVAVDAHAGKRDKSGQPLKVHSI